MIVSELIEALRQQPQDLRVVVNGYEGGYGDISSNNISVVPLSLNFHQEWYYGKHEIPSQYNDRPKEDCKAVLICR